ncbi:hypothetical protein HY605_01715 [Candidatus Peregrinibacteria bacterium]|nr:hypothetical protein [Candidatus Peregrinibacteria bacterium]
MKLTDKEEIVLAVNEHWIYFVKICLAFLVCIAGMVGLFALSESLKLSYVLNRSLLFFTALILVLSTHWFFIYLLKWQASAFYISNKRIIIFELLPFIRNDVTFIKISEIHEIEEHQKGILPNVLNYGKLTMNLAASPDPIELFEVPEPSRTINIIEAIRNKKMDIGIHPNELIENFKKHYKYLVNQ